MIGTLADPRAGSARGAPSRVDALSEEAVVAVGTCRHCGTGLCPRRLGEAARHRVGGVRYGCPHHLERADLLARGIAREAVRDSQAPEPFRAVR